VGNLLRHLDARHVFTGIAATERDDVLRDLLARLTDSGAVGKEDAVTVLRAVLKRERVGSTGIGRGVAIPHSKTAAVAKPLVAFGRTVSPVEWGSTDGAPVRSVFLVVSRPEDAEEHVGVLKTISAFVRDDYSCRVLSNTQDAELLFDLLRELDGKF
jgi:PTS system fructose-specific IIA component/PTS system nitrogen regulatory IIA component